MFSVNLGYNRYLTPDTYPSLQEIIPAIQVRMTSDTGWCSPLPLDHVDYDYVPGPWMGTSSPAYPYPGVDTLHQHRLNFNVSAFTSSPVPCSNHTTYQPFVRQGRDVTCPPKYVLIYEAGPPQVGPYCALEWTKVDEDKSVGSCSTGQVSKGNPCEIGTGNKYQIERDYGGGALKFERRYNSVLAKNYGYSSSAPRWEPLGVGWSADYFQRIDFNFSSIGTAFVTRADGKKLAFNASGTSFIAPEDVEMQLSATRDAAGTIVGWTLITESNEIENYDATGKLLSVVTSSGNVHAAQYNSIGLLQSVTDSFGRQLQFTFDVNRLLTRVTDPAGGFIDFAYSSTHNLLSATYPNGAVRQYHYEVNGTNLLTGITDENGQRHSTYTYNSYTKQLATTELAGGINKYAIGYYSDGSRIVTDPLNKQRTYGFGVKQGVPRVTSSTALCQGCGEWKSASYDANGNASVRVDFSNIETHYGYDPTRNLETSRTEAYGTPRARTITTQWHSTYRLPTQIDEPGKRTAFTYDSSGNALTKTILDTTSSESRTWTYTYNSFGQVLTADGPRTDVSDVTIYTYYNCTTGYQCGQVNMITNALGHVTTYNTYNAHGQPLTITDPNGVVTTLTYDLRQRLTSRTVGTELTSFEYWPTGLLKKAILPDGSYLQYTYDAAHRLTGINDGDNNHIVYTLDAMGNRTKDETFDPTNALRQTRSRVFNTLNQLSQEIGAADTPQVTTTFGYDNNGNQTSIAAPMSRTTGQTYDELNRLTTVIDPGSGITTYGYNALDQLISVTDPRTLTTTYSYNGLGDLMQQVSPDTGTTTNTFDSGGNLKTSTDARNAITTYTYDVLNRVLTAEFKIGTTTDQTITYSYDAGTHGKGHLTAATDADHALSWTYDAVGRVTGKGQSVGAVTQSVGYGYVNGQLTTMTLPSGQVVTYGYNSNNQVTSVTVGTTTILSSATYQPFGPVTGWTWGNATTMSRTFDTDGKLTQFNSGGLKTYAYDDAFRITGITDTVTTANSWTYGYDVLDRITSGNKTGTTLGWTYDANGNRLTQTGSDASTYTVSSTTNRISATTGALARTYTYDAAGNTLGYTDATATYNNRGRMKTLVKAGVTATYTYDALGQRIKQSGGTPGTVLYMYDEAGHLIGEYSSTGALVQETVWLDDIPVATLRPNGASVSIYYVHTDHLNTPIRVTRPSDNKLMWSWNASPFGTDAPNENPASGGTFKYNLRFPGQLYDSHAGLHQNHHRDYDPAIGRFPQSDPTGLDGGLNTYSYVEADPIGSVDDDGLRRRSARSRNAASTGLVPYRPPGSPWFRVDFGGGSQCGICLDVFYVARVEGYSRSTHRSQANEQFYGYISGSSGPLRMDGRSSRAVARDMRGPGGMRNPSGYEWHHPVGRPNEIWLVRRCDHRDPLFRPFLHPLPGGRGGFSENF